MCDFNFFATIYHPFIKIAIFMVPKKTALNIELTLTIFFAK